MCNFVFLLSLATLLITPLASAQYKQILDTNLPNPTQINIVSESFQIDSDATVPLQIESPSFLSTVYKTKLIKDETDSCWIEKQRPQKLISDYIHFQKHQLGTFQTWDNQIIESTYSYEQQKVFALLTNGSIIIASLRSDTFNNLNKVQTFQLHNFHGTSQDINQIWQLSEYQMFYQAKDLYLFKQKQFSRIVFTQIQSKQNSSLMEKVWTIKSLIGGSQISKVIRDNDDMFLLTKTNVREIYNNTISKDLLKFSKVHNFVDMAIQNQIMYILCKDTGIVLVNIRQQYNVYNNTLKIDYPDMAYQIRVVTNTIFINYELQRRNFIAQLFLMNGGSQSLNLQLRLNKFYYRFQEMNQIVPFNHFGIAFSMSQMTLFQHSINRNGPFGELQTELFIYRHLYAKIVDIIPLDKSKITFILVQKDGISVQSLKNNKSTGIITSKIKCVFSDEGKYQIAAQYQGFCGQFKFKSTQDSYCIKKQNYTIYVESQRLIRVRQNYNHHTFTILLLFVVFVLLIGAALTYRKSTIQRRQRLQALLARRASNNNEIFSGQIQPSLQEKKNQNFVIQQ